MNRSSSNFKLFKSDHNGQTKQQLFTFIFKFTIPLVLKPPNLNKPNAKLRLRHSTIDKQVDKSNAKINTSGTQRLVNLISRNAPT